MRKHVGINLALAALVVLVAGCPTKDDSIIANEPAGGEVRIYEVFGMNCPGCHGSVEKLVRKIPAVETVEADWEKKTLKVTVRPGNDLDDDEIYDAITRANFTPGKRIQ